MRVTTLSVGTIATAILISTAAGAWADKKPKGAKKTDPQTIIQLYAGKTSNWNRGGHAYWGPGGVYKGIIKDETSVGNGKWYVTTNGKLCSEATWYWKEGAETKSGPFETCWEFVTAPDGTVWERFLNEKSEWYRHKPEKQVNGDTQRNKFNRIAKQLGL